MEATKKTDIYVGLNDSETYQQKFITEKYLSILKTVCKNYGVAFSVSAINGGYFHDNGTYVEENSLVLTLLDTEDSVIESEVAQAREKEDSVIGEIAKDLCVFFHQESVMVVTSNVEMGFLSEKL